MSTRHARTAPPGDPAAEPSLDRLLASVRACRHCVEAPAGPPLPHAPEPIIRAAGTARLVIASQAPGTLAHASATPFNDPSGTRLRAWLGVDRDTFYDERRIAIVPMGFCFPGQDAKGGDLPPRRECAPLWRARVFAHLPRVELILAIGQYAIAWHLGARRRATLTETVGAWREHAAARERPVVLPLPHPSWRNNAWLRRNPWFERELVPHVQAEVARLVG